MRLCRVARTSFTEQQCMENVAAVVKGAIEHIPRKWKNVQAGLLRYWCCICLLYFSQKLAHATILLWHVVFLGFAVQLSKFVLRYPKGFALGSRGA